MNGSNQSSNQGSTKSKDQRDRFRFQFLLDLAKDRDYKIAEKLYLCRQMRSMTAYIRDAVDLYMSLQGGDTTLLYRLFPHLKPNPDTDITKVLNQLAGAVASLQVSPSN